MPVPPTSQAHLATAWPLSSPRHHRTHIPPPPWLTTTPTRRLGCSLRQQSRSRGWRARPTRSRRFGWPSSCRRQRPSSRRAPSVRDMARDSTHILIERENSRPSVVTRGKSCVARGLHTSSASQRLWTFDFPLVLFGGLACHAALDTSGHVQYQPLWSAELALVDHVCLFRLTRDYRPSCLRKGRNPELWWSRLSTCKDIAAPTLEISVCGEI